MPALHTCHSSTINSIHNDWVHRGKTSNMQRSLELGHSLQSNVFCFFSKTLWKYEKHCSFIMQYILNRNFFFFFLQKIYLQLMNPVMFSESILSLVLLSLLYYLYLVKEIVMAAQLITIKKILTRAWGQSRQSPLSIFPRRVLGNDGKGMQAANEICFQ